jgi:hypothetical protein
LIPFPVRDFQALLRQGLSTPEFFRAHPHPHQPVNAAFVAGIKALAFDLMAEITDAQLPANRGPQFRFSVSCGELEIEDLIAHLET